MSYRTILLHADMAHHAGARYTLGCRLAAMLDAHLIGAAATGISRFAPAAVAAGIWPLTAEHMTQMSDNASKALEACALSATAHGVNSYESRLLSDDAASALLLQSSSSDLLVLSQDDGNETLADRASALVPSLLLHGARPILVVPKVSRLALDVAPCQHPLLAWDGSNHSARALLDALPLLKLARQVTLLVLNAEQHASQHGQQAGADMALFLARHGVQLELISDSTELPVAEAILAQARTLGSDLLVMGGYGHTRWSEAVLGGVTSTILDTMDIPVLVAH
ncbi:universal stress protein [Duganella fentianensis]|uniref:universal stress protein n=1 Tax=Duganella fentianensis TaxID=2692177 RepID=UPI0032B259FD